MSPEPATISIDASNYISMKHFFPVLLLLSSAFGQAASPPPSSQTLTVDQANAQKAKVLLDQMVQALGGQAYLSIQDITQEGRTYGFHLGEPKGVGTQFWRLYRYPDKDRIELTKKRDVVYVFNADKGYEITYKGTREQDAKDVTDYMRRRQYALDYVIRKWLTDPGIALFYEGQTIAAQKPTEQVTITNAQNQSVTLYIDTDTHLPVKKTFSWRDPTDKQRNSEDEVFDGYRQVQGVMTPFSITRFYNGDMSNQRFLNEVKYNQGIDDSKFSASVPNTPNAKH